LQLNLHKKILLMILGIVLGIGIISTSIVYYISVSNSEREANLFYDRFNNSLAADQKSLEVALTAVMNRPDFQAAFIAQDRDRLLVLTNAYFAELKARYNITHLYFHNLDSTVFLRVHKPASFGDKIDRYTLKSAVSQGKMVGGLETGLTAFAYRVVSPVSVNGKLIGYEETGEEIDKVLQEFKQQTNADITFVINENMVDKKQFDSNRIYSENSVIYASTDPDKAKTLMTAAGYSIDNSEKSIFKPLVRKNGNNFYLVNKFLDASGKPVGDIIITGNADKLAGTITTMIITIILLSLVTVLLAFVFSRSISKPVVELASLMTKAENGDLTVRGKNKNLDEIGKLSRSFNQMLVHQAGIVGTIRAASEDLAAASQEMVASSEEVTASAGEVSNSIDKVADFTVNGNQSIIEASNSLRELLHVVRKANEQAEHAAGSTQVTLEAAFAGQSTVKQTVSRMLNIKQKTLETEELISTLNVYAKQIDKITQTITGLASQTNLLALNAAIEAARAGEAGRGFAVVADEVRKLAELSNKEASDAAALLSKITDSTAAAVTATQQSRTEVEVGVTTVNKAGQALEQIVTAVNNTVDDVNGIVDIANQTVLISDEIVRLVDSVASVLDNTADSAQGVAQVTRETTAAMQTVASSSEEVSSMAMKLKSMVEQFKVN
jgi:methyl-accepting chemotaxis protein